MNDEREPQTVGALLDAAPADVSAEEMERREKARHEASMALLREMRKADAVKRWERACPEALRVTDWSRPSLKANDPQIERVLGYKLGGKGMVASGPTGRGKSRAMFALMRRLGCEEGHDVRYYNAADWFSELQSCIRYGRDEARGWVETVALRHVVFIDDLGQEAMQTSRAEWAQGWFFRFLDIRVGSNLPLFVTTNLSADQMAEKAGTVRGDPLVRRILDVCEPVKFV